MSRRSVVLLVALSGCGGPLDDDPGGEPTGDAVHPMADVQAEGQTVQLQGLQAEVHVLVDAWGNPHVYAENERDLAFAQGFVTARDRFFMMDMNRRLATGTVSALLGDAGIETDVESRMVGQAYVTDRVTEELMASDDLRAQAEGFAAGVNAYIEAVRRGDEAGPTLYEDPLVQGLLGVSAAHELMDPFTVRDVAAGIVTVLYQTDFETKDVGRARDLLRLDGHFDGAPFAAERTAGLLEDVWGDTTPIKKVASAPGFGRGTVQAAVAPPALPTVEDGVLGRMTRHHERLKARFGHDTDHGWGSNAWAVASELSEQGGALLASDGHLPLSVPALLYQMGLDTSVLGEGDTHVVGLMVPGMMMMGVGTNGEVAWGQTNLVGDITDWYAEEIALDAQGRPFWSLFDDSFEQLEVVTEEIVIRDVPALDSVGRTVSFQRYVTFDGRWLTGIEGFLVQGPNDDTADNPPLNMMGDWVSPKDVDGDGRITGVSFDYAGLDITSMARTLSAYTKASDVHAFREITRDFVAYGLNMVVADAHGEVFYTGYQAVPCRGYLERGAYGAWAEGSDPNMLLDGNRYGGFTIPHDEGGHVVSEEDPYRCVVPFEAYPQVVSPEQGYVVTANNDPGGMGFDGSLANDDWYIGGPWFEGHRADEISREIEAAAAEGGVGIDDMQRIQADHTSVLGRDLVPYLLQALDDAEAYAAETEARLDDWDDRAGRIWSENAEAFDEVRTRLVEWGEQGGYEASSGVETFYETPTEQEKRNAVATTLFNTWLGMFMGTAVHDEGFPGLSWPSGDTSRLRILYKMLEHRGPEGEGELASWHPDRQESVFFDDLSSEERESSTESMVLSLKRALDLLEQPPSAPGQGGFGTDDMDAWLWGLRHHVRFTPLLEDFIGSEFSMLTGAFGIDPGRFPVLGGLEAGDERASLPGFPRHGDNNNVDAGDPGFGAVGFDYSYGPVNRFVVAFEDDGVQVRSVIPGGQSGRTDSPHFDDQARLWLANEAVPLPIDFEQVKAGAVRHDVFTP